MSGLEYILAATLLAAPPGTPEPPIAPENWPTMQAALQQTAIEWEILDEREVRYIFAKPESFEKDLNLLRQRNQELADAPHLWESERFPDRSVVNDLLTFNRSFRKQLENRELVETDRAEMFRSAGVETDRLYHIYDLIRDAKCDFYYVTVRRTALKKLREALGMKDFYQGSLPPIVPTWYFKVMR